MWDDTTPPLTLPASPAARRWAEELAAWAIPDEILQQAPESPWGFPPTLFAPDDGLPAESPSIRRARTAIPDGGVVLDVGAGRGAASLPLAPPAATIIAVDESAAMLDAFAVEAGARGVAHREVTGTWPQIASDVPAADVAVCHHVLYNVADLERFVATLADHARTRVVAELTDRHPMVTLAPLWQHFWSLERPHGPTADDAIAILRDLGLEVTVDRWARPPRGAGIARAERVAFVRRRLCLPAERDREVDALLDADAVISPRDVVTLSWNGAAR